MNSDYKFSATSPALAAAWCSPETLAGQILSSPETADNARIHKQISKTVRPGHTFKSDVWSFGVLLWEMFTFGLEPFSGRQNQIATMVLLEKQHLPVKPCAEFG